MPRILVAALGREGVAPREISPRLRNQLNYFMSSPGEPGVPDLAEGEFWFDRSNVATWLNEGVFHLVSPLDTANKTEEQEDFLGWLHASEIQHVRVVGS
jgi:hypothetical protein